MVMMSGGVDSSVAAAVLRDEGHDVTGVTLKLWGGESDSGCCSVVRRRGRPPGRRAARHPALRVQLHRRVRRPRRRRRTSTRTPSGETPNPCVECNRSMKFGRVLDRADAARLRRGRDRPPRARRRLPPTADAIARGADPAKDQSYVLYMLGRDELARTLLPIGEMTKAEVRGTRARLGLRTADEAREHGRVLHHPGRAQRVPRRPHRSHARARSSTPPGRDVGAHDGVDPASRSVSGGEPASRWASAVRRRHRRRHRDGHRRAPRSAPARSRPAPRPLVLVHASAPTCSRRPARTANRSRLDSTATRCSSPRPSHASRPARSSRCYDGDVLLGGGIAAA